MIKKIAKKSLLILLLFIITLYGVLTPIKNVHFETNTCSAASGDAFRPKIKTNDVEEQEVDQEWCPDCTASVQGMTFWRMLVAPIDTLLSLIPRLLVFISKWIVILFANILQSAMNPRANSFLDGINRFTGEGNVARWVWQNSLYFANIMITLFLIWIAINIILEKAEYTSYQSLIKLLTVALLINFSLVICTLLVDISNYIASLFMSGVNGQAFSCTYACAIHKVANSFNCVADKMMLSQTIQNSLALVVAIIFIGQLLGLIIFVFTRMVYLWFLVGVSPLAIVLSAIPETEGIYKQWLNLFKTNLIKLPAIAAATYFILNIILFITNQSMNTPVAQGDVMEHVLTTTFLIIVLSQGLLMAAQAIGVEQVTKMSAMVNGAVKKGWNAIKAPVAQQSKRFAANVPIVRKGTEMLQNSSVPWIAKSGNKLAAQVAKDQKNVATNMEDLFANANWRSLERLAESKDPTVRVQAMSYLSQLGSKYKAKNKYTEDPDKINAIKKLADDNVNIDNSAAYDTLKKTSPLFKTGIKSLRGQKGIENINDTVGEISAALNDDKGAMDIQSTLDTLIKNAGSNLPYLMKTLQRDLDPYILNGKAKSLGNKGYLSLMDTLAKGIIVAKKIKNNEIAPAEIDDNLNGFMQGSSTENAEMRNYIKNHLVADAVEIAESTEYNFFGKWGRKGPSSFKRTAQGRLYINMDSNSSPININRANTNNNAPQNTTTEPIDRGEEPPLTNDGGRPTGSRDAAPAPDSGRPAESKDTAPTPDSGMSDVKDATLYHFNELRKEIREVASDLQKDLPEIKDLIPKINAAINYASEDKNREYISLRDRIDELKTNLESNTSYTFSTKDKLELLIEKLEQMERLREEKDHSSE